MNKDYVFENGHYVKNKELRMKDGLQKEKMITFLKKLDLQEDLEGKDFGFTNKFGKKFTIAYRWRDYYYHNKFYDRLQMRNYILKDNKVEIGHEWCEYQKWRRNNQLDGFITHYQDDKNEAIYFWNMRTVHKIFFDKSEPEQFWLAKYPFEAVSGHPMMCFSVENEDEPSNLAYVKFNTMQELKTFFDSL